MNEEQFNTAIGTLGEQLLNLTAHVTRLQSYINALELFVAVQASPENPMLVLEALRASGDETSRLEPNRTRSETSCRSRRVSSSLEERRLQEGLIFFDKLPLFS